MADKNKKDKKASGGDKKARVKHPKLDSMITSLARAAKTEERIAAAKATADKVFKKAGASLIAWGKRPVGAVLTNDEIVSEFAALKEQGFVAPTARVTIEPMTPGTPVEIVADFIPSYKLVYTQDEIDSMVYEYMDEVNKLGMCKTNGRFIPVKFKHIVQKNGDAAEGDILG